VSGALRGLEGVLLRKKNNFRVVFSLDLIAQSIVVEVDADEVEPLSPSERCAPIKGESKVHL
jgi:hypothetical protein